VTGLGGTGGKGPTTRHFAKNYFLNSETQPQDVSTKNLSVVEIFLEVPPFCKPGEKLIATVSVIDDASSLAGGVLSNTALKGIDGAEYATAFGPLDIDGIAVSGSAGSVGKNFPTVGKVQAQLEVEICNGPVFKGNSLRLLLHNKDESTAFRIATEINRYFPRCAEAHHSGFVDVQIPQGFVESPNAFVYMINQLRVEPDNTARVVFNRKTGTIVIGENVRLSSVMFAKDNLVVSTSETPIVSQPAPFSQGQTVALPRTQIQVSQEGSRYNVMQENMNVIDLAKALNALGVSPQDIMSIFDGIKKEGSLHAELVID
jgi:flagellar P-ring protein precursor FlgI